MKISLFSAFLLLLASSVAHAGSATWNLNPASGGWNTAANWTPATVPNGPGDTATFATSNITTVVPVAPTEVDEIAFGPGASAFTIAPQATTSIIVTLSGAGVTNNSGISQTLMTAGVGFQFSEFLFTNSASAAGAVIINNGNSRRVGSGGMVQFMGSSTAGNATIVNMPSVQGNQNGGGFAIFFDSASAGTASLTNAGSSGSPGFIEFVDTSTAGSAAVDNQLGFIFFYGSSTAADGVFVNNTKSAQIDFLEASTAGNATITTRGSDNIAIVGSAVLFGDTATADHAHLTIEGGMIVGAPGGNVQFYGSATAGSGTFLLEGGGFNGAAGGTGSFSDSSRAGNATFDIQGGAIAGADGARLTFAPGNVNAENATLIAHGGIDGGEGGKIIFQNNSNGGKARIEIFGNGLLDLSAHLDPKTATIGSVEGDGQVSLGSNTMLVGGNNLDTTFAGLIEDEGEHGNLNKSGKGALTLGGANAYTGTTTVSQGTLAVSNQMGSATGSGAVSVNAGTLGGSGIIAGATTIGTGSGAGAFLAPALGRNKQVTVTILAALTLKADATYTCSFRSRGSKVRNDVAAANGITLSGATFALQDLSQGVIPAGTVLTVLDNTAATPISGTFSNLPDGATITAGNNTFQANYSGGDGNDLTLTVVP